MRDDSVLRNFSHNELTSKQITDAANTGDPIAIAAFDATAKYFARVIADTVAILSPQKIFLFGGLANAGDILIAPTKKYARELCLESMRNTFGIEMSKLPATNAAVLGAAALMWEKKRN
jgi:glucokinase